MPTENRSSNTEMVSELLPCPFCGQQDFLIERLDSDASIAICQGLTGPHEACLARGPVGVAQDEGEEQPGRDKAVELWNARVAQLQGEPVGEVVAFGKGLHEIAWAAGRMPRLGAKLYTHPAPADPGEVERLRAALKFYADRDHFAEDIGSEWDSVSGEPANILWHEHEAWFVEDGSIASAALSENSEAG